MAKNNWQKDMRTKEMKDFRKNQDARLAKIFGPPSKKATTTTTKKRKK